MVKGTCFDPADASRDAERSSEVKIPGWSSIRLRCLTELPLDDGLLLYDGLQDITGLKVWPGSYALLSYLATHGEALDTSRRVIELGCGTGIVGLHVAQMAGIQELVVSDGNERAVDLSMHNIQLNRDLFSKRVCGTPVSVSARRLRWGNEEDLNAVMAESVCTDSCSRRCSGFDAVYACDVIYNREVLEPLMQTAAALLSNGGIFLLSLVPRCLMSSVEMERMIVQAAASVGLRLRRVVPVDELLVDGLPRDAVEDLQEAKILEFTSTKTDNL